MKILFPSRKKIKHHCKLIFCFAFIFLFGNFADAQLVINEVSQGASGSKEYVEFVVTGTPTCAGIPCVDLRGWIIDDNNGNHATGAGTGIATGCIRFTNNALWSCVPAGEIIVVYNDADINASLPANDLSLTDGNCRLVIPVSNCTLFEKNTSLPSTATPTYPTSGFVSCGNWTNISMANTDDSFQAIDPSGTLFHSVSWGNNSLSPIIYFAGSATGKVAWNNNSVNTNPSLQANWSFTTVAGNETPGAPNNAANAAWINSMNNNCSAYIPLTAGISSTNASCNCTGTATVIPTGGTAPYSFSWTPSGGTASTANNLCAGNYTCTITDAIGCSQTMTVNVSGSGTLALNGNLSNVTCNGACNGSATATVTSGTPPFTYSWFPSGGTSASANGLCPGNYTCTVTDGSGCTATQSFTITEPSPLTSSGSQVNLSCNGINTGTATISVTGGTGPYSYSWNPAGGSASTASGLSATTYTCTATDLSGCIITQSFSITQPSAIVVTSSQTSISCNGGAGSATVNVSGGIPGYTYSWSPSGGNTATATGLSAGTYTCTVSDANSCLVQNIITLTQPSILGSSLSGQTDVICNGGNTGSAALIVSGGTPGYSYSWSPSGGNSASANGLSVGNYTCTVTDANGCIMTQSFSITQPAPLSVTSSQSDILCNGNNSGSATVTVSGGTPGYSYSWLPSGGNAATATNLLQGNYTCTITDVNNCTLTHSFSITQPPALVVSQSATAASCGNNNGSAIVNVSGGTPSYSYSWTPSGGNSATANNLSQGNYSCTITDANGCTDIQGIVITNPGAPTLSITSLTDVSCFGGNNGSAISNASGGTGPYSYNWLPSGGNAATANTLSAGNYSLTVTDALGCIVTQSFIITEPPAITASGSSNPVSCFGGNNGTAGVTTSGGTPAYSYSWSPAGGNSATAISLIAGNYSCTITDAHGCSITSSVAVTEPPQLSSAVSVSNVLCAGGNNGTATVTPSGGTPAYAFVWSPAGGNSAVASGLNSGNYNCTITDNNGCIITQTVTVTEPAPLSVTVTSTPSSCGNPNGSASAAPSGGTGSYSYSWSPGGYSTASVNGLAAGNYSVIVTDQNGCTTNGTVTIGNQSGVVATLASQTNVNCFGFSNGTIHITQNGGNLPYTYNWSPNVSTSDSATSLSAGNYVCTVTDAGGCSSSLTITITEPPQLSLSTTANPTGVCVGMPVQLSAIAAGGTPAYSILWNPGNLNGANQTIIPASTGTYVANLVDQNGCTTNSSVTVTVFPSPAANFSADSLSGCTPVCVNFSDSSLSASQIISWNWNFGNGDNSTDQNPVYCYLNSGMFDVNLQVTNADGCSNTFTMTSLINALPTPDASFTVSPQPTTTLNPEVFFTDASTNADSWNWNFGDVLNSSSTAQNPSFIYSDPTCYMVTLTVANFSGCTDIATHEVCIDPEITIYIPNSFSPNGDGLNDIFLPKSEGLMDEGYELQIFDRWGNLIFESHALNEGWDGKVKDHSKISQMDTYVWKLHVMDVKFEEHDLIGHVNLVK
jgi:gliding motility-associated-like protein